MGRRQANSGPKANCGKPTHTLCIIWAVANRQRPEGQLRQANTHPIIIWAVANRQRPEGRLRQANTHPMGRRQANSGPKASCGEPHTTLWGGGKPTAARRPTAASHTHPIHRWAAASQQRPEGQLWRATHNPMHIYIYMHTSYTIIH